MQTLLRTLNEYDLELIRVIANRWDVDLKSSDVPKSAEQLAAGMLRTDKVTEVWSHLPDEQRQALQALLGSGGKMLLPMFSRLYGAIRTMGPDRLAREKPYLAPQNIAEHLYYRGLIAVTYGEAEGDKVKKPVQQFIYVPTDLAPLMPTKVTGYKEEPRPQVESVPTAPQPDHPKLADTTIVDDLTTLLAACQIEDVPFSEGNIPKEYRDGLKPYFLGTVSPVRVSLLCALAVDMGMAAASGDKAPQVLKPVGQRARTWLDSTRPAQVRALAEAWRRSTTFNELRQLAGIKVEKADNDPLLARQTVLTYFELLPSNDWWPVEPLVEAVKEDEPDFLRLDGNYDSWYIRDAQSGEYLRGFETSWDKIEGALLRFILIGPMHGLGLLDIANDGKYCRLTAYGRAFLDLAEWPDSANAPKEGAPIRVSEEGVCEVPRQTSRYERFQLARFTEWLASTDPYKYKVSASGMELARQQGIRAEQVVTFLRRVSDEEVPDTLVKQIDLWGQAGGPEPATISRLTVLRVPRPDMLDSIMSTPALRRYLGTPLGPDAVTVREGQWEALAKALRDSGIAVEADLS